MSQYHLPRYEELPDFPVFVDQVVYFIENKLQAFYVDGEKIITNSMVNNYVKQGLVDPPVKKKYGRTHLVYFIAVCMLKKSFTLEEIDTIIKKVIERLDIPTAYNYFCDEFESCLDSIFNNKEIVHTPYYSGEDELVYVCQTIVLALTYKIYAQTRLIEMKNEKE